MNARAIPEHFTKEIIIVLVGDFNPKIFQPAWFAAQGLLRPSEAEAADIEIIHPEVTSFRTDWLALQVTRERFSVTTTAGVYKIHLRDLLLGTFNKLIHSPVVQLGFNYSETIKFNSESEWHDFGHFVMPKSPWKDLISHPGMMNLSVRGVRTDEYLGNVNVTVASAYPNAAIVQVNDHYDLKTSPEVSASVISQGLEILERNFEVSLQKSEGIILGLLNRFVAQREFDNGVS